MLAVIKVTIARQTHTGTKSKDIRIESLAMPKLDTYSSRIVWLVFFTNVTKIK